ncbi:MAG: AEC family transporter [Gammaproteobacteria bacterium]|nr:AEC family transporter [Gammaproteobacteria bacterium]MDH3447256.1 AEC family transporter [Gammaproteobacteria bacterium]
MASQTELIYRIFAIIFPIFSIVAIGYFYARYRHDTDVSSGNRINMDIFTPALIFDYMSSSSYALEDYLLLSLGCIAVVLGSGIIAWPVARIMGYQWKTLIPPMMFNNCGNMGLPLVVLTFGEGFLPAAILLLAISNFLHFLVGQQLITQQWSIRTVFTNPMILSTILGIAVSVSGIVIPETLRLPIHMLGMVSIPLMLFSLGVRMIAIDFRDWGISSVGSLLCPLSGLISALIFIQLVPLPAAQVPLLLLFSILPPAVLNYMVAERYSQEPHRVASIVLVGNLSSLVVIPIALWFIL